MQAVTQSQAAADTDMGGPAKAKMHEAQMIPGVDGYRVFGFPNSIITKLRYCDQFRVTSTAGAVN